MVQKKRRKEHQNKRRKGKKIIFGFGCICFIVITNCLYLFVYKFLSFYLINVINYQIIFGFNWILLPTKEEECSAHVHSQSFRPLLVNRTSPLHHCMSITLAFRIVIHGFTSSLHATSPNILALCALQCLTSLASYAPQHLASQPFVHHHAQLHQPLMCHTPPPGPSCTIVVSFVGPLHTTTLGLLALRAPPCLTSLTLCILQPLA